MTLNDVSTLKTVENTKLAPFIGHTMPKTVLEIENNDSRILIFLKKKNATNLFTSDGIKMKTSGY